MDKPLECDDDDYAASRNLKGMLISVTKKHLSSGTYPGEWVCICGI